MATVFEQRAALLRNIQQGFDLTDDEAQALTEALRRGSQLAEVMHSETMVGHTQCQGRHELLVDELRDYLTSQHVAPVWITMLAKIRSQFQYIYYILRDGETYGSLRLLEHPI